MIIIRKKSEKNPKKIRKNRKQIQLEQWIILIIRCAIPILLALTLARMVVMNWNSFLFFVLLPLAALLFLIIMAFTKRTRIFWGLLCGACLLVTGLGALGFLPDWGKDHKLSAASGDVPASTVILLDDSLSMNAEGSFSKAQDFISGFLGNMHTQSETSILQLGGITTPIFDKPTSDPNALVLRTENLDAEGDHLPFSSPLVHPHLERGGKEEHHPSSHLSRARRRPVRHFHHLKKLLSHLRPRCGETGAVVEEGVGPLPVRSGRGQEELDLCDGGGEMGRKSYLFDLA